MSRLSDALLRTVDELQQDYIEALDRGDMAGWLAAFSPAAAASYVCISAENDDRDFGLALMLDDCRARLEDRVTFVTQVWAGTFQAYRMRHFVQRTSARQAGDGILQVHSNFAIMMTPEGGTSALLAVGHYQDRIVIEGDGTARFLEKKVVYDTTVLPRYVVYPF